VARRSDHSRDELYRLATVAARKIVETRGIEALTARSVADAIGYSPGTLYNVFDNFEALIVRLNGSTLDKLHDELSAIPRMGRPAQDLRALLAAYLGFQEANPNLWTALFGYSLAPGHPLPDWYTAKVERVLGLVEAALEPLFAPGEREDLGNAARILWASVHGICSLSLTGKLRTVTTQSLEEMTETLMACFVYSLETVNAGRPGAYMSAQQLEA